jgi:hypothetical protein
MAIATGLAGSGKTLLNAVIAEMLANQIGGALSGGLQSAVTPQPGPTGSGSKFMVTLNDLRNYQAYAANENLKRQLLRQFGIDLPTIDVAEEVRNREAQLRQSAAEAGQRERMIKQLETEAENIASLAKLAGTQATALGNMGGTVGQAYLGQPPVDPALAEAARAL